MLLARLRVAVVEDVELELGGHVGEKAALLEAGELALEHGTRAVRQLVAVMVDDVAQHQGGAGEPGDLAQGAEVRADGEVAIALVPGGGLEARDRLHLHVDGEEIVAGVPFLAHGVHEVAAGHALADQPALHVGEGGDDRVDLACVDQALERLEVEPTGHAVACSLVFRPPPMQARMPKGRPAANRIPRVTTCPGPPWPSPSARSPSSCCAPATCSCCWR